jgi:hypothetical protein
MDNVVELFTLADKVARETEAQDLVVPTPASKEENPSGNPRDSGGNKNKRKGGGGL